MAKVNQRKWKIPGRRTKRTAWGFTVVNNRGKQERHYRAEWTKDDAEEALAKLLLEIEEPKVRDAAGLTFGEAVERYLKAKARKKSIKDDERHLTMLRNCFGAGTLLADITAARISAWKADRLAAICPQTERVYSAATINRPLAALRHLLRLAHEEWEVLPAVPRIRLEREPEGRIRWLEADEEDRLLAACRASRNSQLAQIVTVALETGMRKSELMNLSWDRVDLSRGVIRLEITKSGRRREVPMRQAVYDSLSAMPELRLGRVWKHRKVRTAFEHAVGVAKLDDFRFNDTRHHYASWFVMRGGRVEALQKILGHATLAMAMRYAHLAPDYLRSEGREDRAAQNHCAGRQPCGDRRRFSARDSARGGKLGGGVS
jgi:integrase